MGSVEQKTFTFDNAYDEDATQEQVYIECAQNIINEVVDGYNGTIFCYGQTGTGKTFTMTGIENDPVYKGIMPRAFEDIYEMAQVMLNTDSRSKVIVKASYIEIYNEEIRDLLSTNPKKKLQLHEKPKIGVVVSDLSEHASENCEDLLELLRIGLKNRETASTQMNATSSRSHSLFQIKIERITNDETETEVKTSKGRVKIRVSKLNLVDLAGSEKTSKTGTTGERLKEATKINLSLTTLCHVIHALTSKSSTHIPYRDSTLTRMLQDSLGGNTKTMMISTIGPSENNYQETMSTLRQASRAKKIKNQPKINVDMKDQLLMEYQKEIEYLRL